MTEITLTSWQLFEENYQLMLGLFPTLRHCDRYSVNDRHGRFDLQLEVVDRGPYTTTLRLDKFFHASQLLRDVTMTVRVYHDAKLVEVTGYQECQRVPPPHRVSGHGRYHRGERRQTNRLLNLLLRQYHTHSEQPCPSL